MGPCSIEQSDSTQGKPFPSALPSPKVPKTPRKKPLSLDLSPPKLNQPLNPPKNNQSLNLPPIQTHPNNNKFPNHSKKFKRSHQNLRSNFHVEKERVKKRRRKRMNRCAV